MSHFYQPDDDTWEARMDSYIEEAEKQITALRAALDQERADNAKLRAFAQAVYDARDMDELSVWLPRALDLHELMTNRHEPTALLSGRGEGDQVAERAAALDHQWQKQIDIRRGGNDG